MDPLLDTSHELWFGERGPLNTIVKYKLRQALHSEQTPFQRIDIFESFDYGRILVLDGAVMFTEGDEFIYHEMITHIPLLLHPSPKDLLIIGGGDGGVAREAARHESLDAITLVEIDGRVVECCRTYFPTVAAGLEEPRLRLEIRDGIEFVRDAPACSCDVVVVDSTDPLGPAQGLFNRDFYAGCSRVLRADGIMVVQSESPYVLPRVLTEVHAALAELFSHVAPYWAAIPTYPSGQIYFTLASKRPVGVHPLRPEFFKSHGPDLRYLTPEIFSSCFAVPAEVGRMLAGGLKPESGR